MQRFYISDLNTTDFNFSIKDKEIIHQLTKVLRIKIWESIIFFDGSDSFDYIFRVKNILDKSIDFEDKDRLHVSIELNQVNLNYGFEYEANSWSEIEYDYFTWANSYEEKNGGEVKLYEFL